MPYKSEASLRLIHLMAHPIITESMLDINSFLCGLDPSIVTQLNQTNGQVEVKEQSGIRGHECDERTLEDNQT